MEDQIKDVLNIIRAMRESASYNELIRNWKLFSLNLGISSVYIDDLERRQNMRTIQPNEIPYEILKIWRAKKGTSATWRVLYDVLGESGLQDIAESLITKLWKLEFIELVKCQWQGKVDTLEELLGGKCSNKTLQIIFNEFRKSSKRLGNFDHEPIQLLKDHLPAQPKYYIPRTLFYRPLTELHTSEFTTGSAISDLKKVRSGKLLKNEEELVSTIISIPPPCALIIEDSPGMGKTKLLANLATNISQLDESNKTIVLFIELQELVQRINAFNSSSSVLEAISAYSSRDQISKEILSEMLLRSDYYHVHLFLDGYDEVISDKMDLADSFLKRLKELKNVKIIVTTRPHFRDRLDTIFHEFSYEIFSFNKPDTIDFLVMNWTEKHGVKGSQSLMKFAKQCSEALLEKLSDNDWVIAGTPLHCMMLAELYADEARRTDTQGNLAKPISLFEIYQKFIVYKPNAVKDSSSRQNYLSAHIYYAIMLLFPGWIGTFKPFLNGHDQIEYNTLCDIGLMEISSSDGTPRFIHRTFAEYLLAEFIVTNLKYRTECVGLLFGEILGRQGIIRKEYCRTKTEGYKYCHYKLKYPVISYFVELHLGEYTKKYSINTLLPSPSKLLKFLGFSKFNSEDVRSAVKASCSNDLENIFNYAVKML